MSETPKPGTPEGDEFRQRELVPELLNHLENLGWDAWSEYVSARLVFNSSTFLVSLEAENKRLREALEKIADEIPRVQGNATGLYAYANGWLEFARAALGQAKAVNGKGAPQKTS